MFPHEKQFSYPGLFLGVAGIGLICHLLALPGNSIDTLIKLNCVEQVGLRYSHWIRSWVSSHIGNARMTLMRNKYTEYAITVYMN